MSVCVCPSKSDRHIRTHFFCGLRLVHAFKRVSKLESVFLSHAVPHFGDVPFNLPLVTLTSILRLPDGASGGHSRSAAKVTPGLYGKARSSLLFSGKISSLSGSIFPKNLAFPNPYLFKHPKRKRPMRQKDALKKMSDKREADKIV